MTAGRSLAPHANIPPTVQVYRRILNRRDYFVFEDNRPSNFAFRSDTGEPYVSVALAPEDGPLTLLEGHPGLGLCELLVQDLLDLGLRLTFEPDENESHGDCHVALWDIPDGKDGIRMRRAIAAKAKTLVPPTV